MLGGAGSTTLSAALAMDSTTSIYNFKFCFLISLGRAPQAPSSCEMTCYMQEDASLRVLLVCAKIPAGSGPPKEAVGEADGDGGGGKEKATVWKKKKMLLMHRRGRGKGFLVCFALFKQRGRFPVQALVLNVAWSD